LTVTASDLSGGAGGWPPSGLLLAAVQSDLGGRSVRTLSTSLLIWRLVLGFGWNLVG
jgi:hypothetical protein